MLVMNGIIGAGIFINPYVVAKQVHTSPLILGAWLLGGVVAMAGAFIYADLARLLPEVGGQYAYLREAYSPLVAFLYGWVLLLVIQTGGMAAVTITFAKYFLEGTHSAVPIWVIAMASITALTIMNCFGVRSGGTLQSGLMVVKVVVIAMFVILGMAYVKSSNLSFHPVLDRPLGGGLLSAFGGAMAPVLFAYAGWQTASFVGGELKNPEKDLPRGLVMGVGGVVAIYLAVSFVCLRALGPAGLAATETPASSVMRAASGNTGARLIAVAIAISALGFLSQGILTAPRVYFAMAEDGVFFRAMAWLHPATRVPVFAIALQSVWTMVILLSGTFEQILNYVVVMDWTFFGLSAASLFVLSKASGTKARVPGHPLTTILFCLACAAIVLNTIYRYPSHTGVAIAIMLSGVPVYYLWRRRAA
jgi:basic amino acid/polyamine antiporter, APA family